MTINAVQLTENSWILYNKRQKCGLMRTNGKGYSILGEPFFGDYLSFEELQERLGSSVKFVKSKIKKQAEENVLNDYPVKHIEMFDIETEEKYPTYTKKQGSSDRYAAGYYGVNFNGSWVPKYCPRAKTLNDYPCVGPFKDKISRDHVLRIENNKK